MTGSHADTTSPDALASADTADDVAGAHRGAPAAPGGAPGRTRRVGLFAAIAFLIMLGLLALPGLHGLLIAMLVSPLAFALGAAARPAPAAKWWALGGTGLNLLLALRVLAAFAAGTPEAGGFAGTGGGTLFAPGLGLSLSIGVDSVSVLLIALTALLGPVCVLCSWTSIADRQRLFYAWLLVLQSAMIGVFAARDLALFYISFEFTLLPMFILINVFGSSGRRKAAVKFFLYTFTGSIISLVALLFLAFHASEASEAWSFTLDIGTITERAQTIPVAGQILVMLALMAGFAVKVPLFPVHTWLPQAHTEAPTAGSVILAGVLLKLGTYAIYRLVLPITPAAAYELAPIIGALAIVGIVYAGLICWVQRDVKKLVAYSSVSHLGFCVLGLFALNSVGLTGSVLYMINHGLSTGALFVLIGFMYERYHTRSLDEIGGLAKKMPVWSFFMVFFVMASVGLPGLNGFVSEFTTMMGAFQSYTPWSAGETTPGATWGNLGPWFGVAAATGVIVAAIYLLTMTAKIVWGSLREPAGHDDRAHGLPVDLNIREITALAPLAALCLLFGLYPKPLIDALEPQVNAQVAAIEAGARRGLPLLRDGADRAAAEPRAGADRSAGRVVARTAAEGAAP